MTKLNRKQLASLANSLFACDVEALAPEDRPKDKMTTIAYAIGTSGDLIAKLWRDRKGNFFYCDKKSTILYKY